MLFPREMQNLVRDTMAIEARIGLTTFLAVLVGIKFSDVGETDSDVPSNRQSHGDVLIMVLLMVSFRRT